MCLGRRSLFVLLVAGCVDLSPPRELGGDAAGGEADAGEPVASPQPDARVVEAAQASNDATPAAGPDAEAPGSDAAVDPDAAALEAGVEADAAAPDVTPDVAAPDLAPDLGAPDTGPPDAAPNTSLNLVLRWAFDETMGSVTADSSGNGYHGTYVGTPTTSPMAAPLTFPNAASRVFQGSSKEGVRLTSMPAPLKPTNNVTVMAWYRATTIDVQGGELVSAGNSYLIRLYPAGVEVAKRITGQWTQCRAPVANHLDGKWHHVAGISTGSGLRLYFDGRPQPCGDTPGDNIVYDQGADLWVARHGRPESNHAFHFTGHIDEVRIYRRALSDLDVLALARGAP